LALLVGHPHAGGDLLLMHIKRALPLNDHIHLDLQLNDDTVVGRQEPREQTSLRSALTAAVPGSGRGSTSNYTRAHKHHGGNNVSDRPQDPPSFHPPRAGARAQENYTSSATSPAASTDSSSTRQRQLDKRSIPTRRPEI